MNEGGRGILRGIARWLCGNNDWKTSKVGLKMFSPGVTVCKHGLYLRGLTKEQIAEHLRDCFWELNEGKDQAEDYS